jgi:hypothetical protein
MKTVFFTLILLTGISFLWSADFPICTGSNAQKHPDVVFDGTRYTVVYDSAYEIWAVKVTTNGVLQQRTQLTNDPNNFDQEPTIAFNGTDRFFVVWEKYPLYIWGIIIDLNNTIVYGPFQIPYLYWEPIQPTVAYLSNLFFVAYADWWPLPLVGGKGFVMGIMYDAYGNIQVPLFTIDQTGSYDGDDGAFYHPALTASNTQFLLTYAMRNSPYPQSDITYALLSKRITTTGQVLPSDALQSITLPCYGGPYGYDTLFAYPADLAYNTDNPEYFCAYHWPEDNMSGKCNVYGRRISTSGSLVGNRVSIAATTGRNECAPATAYNCGNYFVSWQDNRNTTYDLFCRFYDQTLSSLGSEITLCNATSNQINTQVAFDKFNNLAVWQDYRNSNWDIFGSSIPKSPSSNESQALAYNGNRHFVRKPNSTEFHLVYTDQGKIIYQYSYNNVDWPILTKLGDGKWPAIAVDANNRAYVTWTDNNGGLWFRYQTGTQTWSSTYHLYTPGSNPQIKSPPAIALVINLGEVYPHIIVTRTGQGTGNVDHSVDDFSFPVHDPGSGLFVKLESRSAAASPIVRLNPTICKDDNDSLHAAWQRTDTIAYATRYRIGGAWNVWGAVMENDGLVSAQPYAEAYGNKIYITWQKKMPGTGIEDVWFGYRQFGMSPPTFIRTNISVTSSTKSLYPMIANGFFKVWADELNSPWDVYYKIYPSDDPANISQTSTTSQYPQTCASFPSPTTYYLYTAWQEGNTSPYQILTKTIQYQTPPLAPYISSPNGQSQPSPLNLTRDSYNNTGSVPIDIGYSSLVYRFRLPPGYFYQLKTTVYQNQTGTWKETIKLDNGNSIFVQFAANIPQEIETWIPPYFYEDTVVDMTISKVSGNYAVLGTIEIYQYEVDPNQGGGPQSKIDYPINGAALAVTPNPLTKEGFIEYALPVSTEVHLALYDASGRLVKLLAKNHKDAGVYRQAVQFDDLTPGVYFLKLTTETGSTVRKIIRMR